MVLCLSLTSRIAYVGQFTDGEMEGDRKEWQEFSSFRDSARLREDVLDLCVPITGISLYIQLLNNPV